MILATNNMGKLKEIKEIFKEYDIKGLDEANIHVDLLEDADTFYGNALKKAKYIYEIVKEQVLADDSGLCIDALDGFPGVFTHRFMGDNATDEERNNYILTKMQNITNRKAKVVSVLVYYDGKNILTGEGILNGSISLERKGNNGFGFDEIFLLNNGKTLAELSSYEKNLVNARKLAATDLKNKLK